MGELKLAVDNNKLREDATGAAGYVEVHEDFVSSITNYSDSLKKAVIALASDGNFEAAKREVSAYQQIQNKTPGFKQRTEHYFNHVRELLDAIQNLKNFPNFDTLRAAQQKQIRERVIIYVEDLSSVLGRVDKITNDLKIQDVRSTTWVVRAFSICLMLFFMMLALREAIALAPTPAGIFVLIEDGLFDVVGL